MANNSTNINKTNNRLSPSITGKKDIWRRKPMSWLETDTNIWRG